MEALTLQSIQQSRWTQPDSDLSTGTSGNVSKISVEMQSSWITFLPFSYLLRVNIPWYLLSYNKLTLLCNKVVPKTGVQRWLYLYCFSCKLNCLGWSSNSVKSIPFPAQLAIKTASKSNLARQQGAREWTMHFPRATFTNRLKNITQPTRWHLPPACPMHQACSLDWLEC